MATIERTPKNTRNMFFVTSLLDAERQKKRVTFYTNSQPVTVSGFVCYKGLIYYRNGGGLGWYTIAMDDVQKVDIF